jgi:para-nitrobenzyl esterase
MREAVAWAGRSPQAPAGAQRPELAGIWGVRDSLPVGEALPAWPAYGTANNDKRVTMIFNDECRSIAAPDGEVRPLWSRIATG